jgi:hypothetical protein
MSASFLPQPTKTLFQYTKCSSIARTCFRPVIDLALFHPIPIGNKFCHFFQWYHERYRSITGVTHHESLAQIHIVGMWTSEEQQKGILKVDGVLWLAKRSWINTASTCATQTLLGWLSGTSFLVSLTVLCGLPLCWDGTLHVPHEAEGHDGWPSAGIRLNSVRCFQHFLHYHKP